MKEKQNNISARIVYYTDEKNDEFSSAVITPRRIDENYKYKRDKGFFGKLLSFILYRMIAVPLAFLYLKIKFRHKIVGKEKLGSVKGSYFIYGNHTQATADALIPTFISMPKKAYVIVHANNVSMPLLGRATPYMGAIPLPDNIKAARNFNSELRDRIGGGKPIFIYPEAHIWPYFTGIRNFPSDSFSYPIRYDLPVFCFTNTYRKRKKSGSVKIITYVDGPFFKNAELHGAEQREELRGRIYNKMTERSLLSDAELISYRHISEKPKD